VASRPARSAAGLALAGLWLATLGCEATAEDTLTRALDAVATGQPEGLKSLLHPDYADTLGDGRQLVEDLEAFLAAHPTASFEAEVSSVRPDPSRPDSDRRVQAELRVAGAWGGEPAFRRDGPMTVTLERWGGYRLRSGFMTDLRDLARWVRAWEVARQTPAPGLVEELIDPNYRDGFSTRSDAIQQWQAHGPANVRVTLARIEVRDDDAHLDLHELVETEGGDRPRIHRLTLRPVAGRWRVAAGLQMEPEPPPPPSRHGKLAPDGEVR